MGYSFSRRSFLKAAAAAGPMGAWVPCTAAPVDLRDEIEPLVELLEKTPRDRLVEALAERVRKDLDYRQALAALLLAGVRNVEPRPSVGFKFHTVLVVQSIHLASSQADPDDRWLPIFWAADYFKDAQADDERQRGWTMDAVDESAVPPAGKAIEAFTRAMEEWDEPAADAAAAALARAAQPEAMWELFFRYGARDYRSIGHKAIDVANTHRVLGLIGWKHAEPALRSLAYALLMHEGENPATRDAAPDRAGRRNLELADRFPDAWQEGKDDPRAVRSLLDTLRDGSDRQAADRVVELLANGASPQSIWDALFLGAGELLVRQPGIIALHSVTTTNALHYAYRFAREDRTRRFLLLQSASFLPLFRGSMHGRGRVGEFRIDAMKPADGVGNEAGAVEAIFERMGRDPLDAARRTLAYFRQGGKARPWIDTARGLVIEKGTGAHDYKFAGAVLEDHDHVSPPWRAAFMAASVFKLQPASRADNPLIDRTRKALRG